MRGHLRGEVVAWNRVSEYEWNEESVHMEEQWESRYIQGY